MELFPAIDLMGGCAVRLLKGDYEKKTVYSEHPEEIAKDFVDCGASHIHIVDLDGAKDGDTPNFDSVIKIKEESKAFCEIGGGIRSLEVLEKYFDAGIDRGILGTAAVTDEGFLKEAIQAFKEKIAVGIDIKDGHVAIKGWLEDSRHDAFDFCGHMVDLGVRTVICTDISKDGAMQGTNRMLYKELSEEFDINITASGGVSNIDDIKYLNSLGIYAAIIGKAYYTKAIDLREAIGVTKG